MATMAPASYTVQLETKITGAMKRNGIRFYLVVCLLALARVVAKSRVTLSATKTREETFAESVQRVAEHPGVQAGRLGQCNRCEAAGVKVNDCDQFDLCDDCTDEVLRENGIDPDTLEPLDQPCDRCHRPGLALDATKAGLLLCGSCQLEVSRAQRLPLAGR